MSFSRFDFIFSAAAFQHVRDNLTDLESTANETDLVFLKGILDNPAVKQLIQVRMLKTLISLLFHFRWVISDRCLH